MTPRQSLINALEGKTPSGRVPHFELVFFLTMEAFNRVHPLHRSYHQWDQMRRQEQELHLKDIAATYIMTAQQYEHAAIFHHGGLPTIEDDFRLIDEIRRQSGDQFFLMMHGDTTYSIPTGEDMMEFCGRLADDPAKARDTAASKVEHALKRADRFAQHGGLDGYALCSDYCFNTGPFFSLDWFDDFITPFLADLIRGYRERGFYVIKHTDGNIMPILDRLIMGQPHALHSLDPQGGVDIAEVKKMIGDRICLIGNVNCGLMQTGKDEEVIESARYALQHGMPGGRYVFSTSNCIYTGMPLERYELILDLWRELGNYPAS
jgi:uroporphyrinogen decarboxylase